MRIVLAARVSLACMAAAVTVPFRADAAPPVEKAAMTPGATRILDAKAAQRLLHNKGLTLQWLDWGRTRGTAIVSRVAGSGGAVWKLRGAEAEAGGPGRLLLDGTITEIGSDYFTFEGRIRIADTPDKGRLCERDKIWHFAVTQKRLYYRLREFEWCDGLTDYIDIHF
jgi:hypothetical protein